MLKRILENWIKEKDLVHELTKTNGIWDTDKKVRTDFFFPGEASTF